MDDAIDQMNKTAKTIVTFEVRVFEPCMQQMSEIIVQSAQLVLEAVPLLSSIGTNAGRLNALTTKLIDVEEEADEVYNRGLKKLFLASREGNAMSFVVGSQHFDHLEKVVDRFEDVANEIARSWSINFEAASRCLAFVCRSLIGLIVVALAFDFLDGVHDTANSIATLVSTRMLRPRYAVDVGRLFQFYRFSGFRRARRANDRRWYRLGRCHGRASDLWCPDRRHPLQSHHLGGPA